MKNGIYVYKEEGVSYKESYQNKILVDFVNLLGYLGGAVPSAETDKKRLKRLIDVSLLIRARSRKDHRIDFGMFEISSISLLLVYPLFQCIF